VTTRYNTLVLGGADWRRTVACLGVALAAGCGPTDNDLRAEVMARLTLDPELVFVELEVGVAGAVVELTGHTATLDTLSRAVDVARAVDGVADVVSRLRASDALIESVVRDALAAAPMLGDIPIQVVARRGRVRLESDQTDTEQRARVLEIISAIDVIIGVDDFMR
jgi:osmotically-inducible protein OsmY